MIDAELQLQVKVDSFCRSGIHSIHEDVPQLGCGNSKHVFAVAKEAIKYITDSELRAIARGRNDGADEIIADLVVMYFAKKRMSWTGICGIIGEAGSNRLGTDLVDKIIDKYEFERAKITLRQYTDTGTVKNVVRTLAVRILFAQVMSFFNHEMLLDRLPARR